MECGDCRLREFEYEHNGIVVRWHLEGDKSPVVIDPRIAFGAPAVQGVPTWVLKGRWESGESLHDIAEDFDLTEPYVGEGLKFEGIEIKDKRSRSWTH